MTHLTLTSRGLVSAVAQRATRGDSHIVRPDSKETQLPRKGPAIFRAPPTRLVYSHPPRRGRIERQGRQPAFAFSALCMHALRQSQNLGGL